MLACRIVRRPLDWPEGSLPDYATLKLSLYFLRAALFERIGAAARDQTCDDERDRRAFHLLILESEGGIAIADCGLRIANCELKSSDWLQREIVEAANALPTVTILTVLTF